MIQNLVSFSVNITSGPGVSILCVILLLSVLLHVQFGMGLPVPLKGQCNPYNGPEYCLDTESGTNPLGTYGATVEMKTCNINCQT